MNDVEAKAVLEEKLRRISPPKRVFVAKKTWRFIAELHALQQKVRAAVDKRKALLWGRRTGKTIFDVCSLLEAAGNHPDSHCAYLTLTREQARRNIWGELKRFSDDYSLGISFNETKLIATLPNGSEILLLGALNANDIERLRGTPFVLVVIDEAGSFPSRAPKNGESTGDLLARLWMDILSPAMLDYQGTIIMSGTPTANCRGFFFEATHPNPDQRKKGWLYSHATVLDNPFVPKVRTAEIPDAKTYLQKEIIEAQGISELDPSFRREWRAEWARSADDLVYPHFSSVRNVYKTIPGANRIEWHYGVSVDLGYDDPTVIGVFMWSTEVPDVYLIRVIKGDSWIISRIGSELKKIEKEFGALSFIVVDQGGGAGKMAAEEMKQRWQLANLKGAEKQKKPTYIGFLNSDFQTGRFKIHESCVPVLDEISVLQWDARWPGKVEDERFANDACDMMLYGWRECRGFAFDQDQTPMEMRPSEAQQQEDDMESQIARGIERENRADLDEGGWDPDSVRDAGWDPDGDG